MSIISISGKIGSGKDTIGTIIQHLVCESKGLTVKDYQLLKYTPPKEEKVSLIEYLNTIPVSLEHQSGWEIKKFAHKLKQIASILTGVPIYSFEDQKFKESEMGDEWTKYLLVANCGEWNERHYFNSSEEAQLYFSNNYKYYPNDNYPDKTTCWSHDISEEKLTYRKFLQLLGTEAGREILHPQIWCNALFSDYYEGETLARYGDFKQETSASNWIITDTRFINEAQAVKDRGGILIRVNRPNFISQEGHVVTMQKENEHPSETALDNYQGFDYIIDNSSNIDSLIGKVQAILELEGIIKKE